MSIPKTVDSTLWSDSFTAILTDLENAPLTSFLTSLEENHAWLVETVSLFKKPNAASRVALTNCFFLIADIKHPVKSKLVKQMDWNGDLFVATFNLLTAAAHKQVATSLFIVHVMGKLVTGDAGSLSVSLV